MSTNENPQAFPLSVSEGQQYKDGMTLRDYFAAKAPESFINGHLPARWTAEEYVQASYHYADAMLAARKEGA